ncbi:hypothetical protein BX666DRAFT_2000467 [Dichotomocladium elegans]|nr:hypothetical protein BX666DRAFT_2000467 [Dichotomocladium elegans]
MDIKSLLCSPHIACGTTTFLNGSDNLEKTLDHHGWSSALSHNSFFDDNSTSSSPDMSSRCFNTSPAPTVASSPLSSPTTLPTLFPRPSRSAPMADAVAPATVALRKSSHQTRTPWTREEDYLLQRGYNQGLSWAMVSTTYLPHRSRGCCWGRFKTLKSKAVEQREWTEVEEHLLANSLKKNSRLFKQAWKAVARDMPNRSWRDCESRFHKVAAGNMVRKRSSAQH